MRFVIEFTPYSSWFWWFKGNDTIRDLGDYSITLFKIQITIWVKKPYYNKSYKKHIKDTRYIAES